jgi:hypothetical protein
MNRFIRGNGKDPFVNNNAEAAPAMYGHLNALVEAINALQNQSTVGWELTGNNTLPPNAYIGSNDPNVNEFNIKLNYSNVASFWSFPSKVLLGYQAGSSNIGHNIAAIGQSAAILSFGSNITAIGYLSLAYSQGSDCFAVGYFSGTDNIGSNVIFLGSRAGYKNNASNVIALGKNAGYNASLHSGNNIAGVTMIATASLPTYVDHAAAAAAITVGNGGVAGTTYLYRRSNDNSIGYVSL